MVPNRATRHGYSCLFRREVYGSEVSLGQRIQESTMKNLWKTTFKKFEVIWSA